MGLKAVATLSLASVAFSAEANVPSIADSDFDDALGADETCALQVKAGKHDLAASASHGMKGACQEQPAADWALGHEDCVKACPESCAALNEFTQDEAFCDDINRWKCVYNNWGLCEAFVYDITKVLDIADSPEALKAKCPEALLQTEAKHDDIKAGVAASASRGMKDACKVQPAADWALGHEDCVKACPESCAALNEFTPDEAFCDDVNRWKCVYNNWGLCEAFVYDITKVLDIADSPEALKAKCPEASLQTEAR